ncbi:MAG: DUF454 domain-containing protein [Firmicutes bacterium]|nr:DUF454 domain-containing protein [Bacillota bacterium]
MTQLGKTVLVLIGSLAVVLAVIGVFVPLLPTTPFLLLAAGCYLRGSEKLYVWLLNHKWCGAYIKNYREKKAIPLKTKIIAIFVLWISIISSAVFFTSLLFIRLMLLLIAAGVTMHLLSLKTFKENASLNDNDEGWKEENE